MNWMQFLFSFDGRISRSQYWLRFGFTYFLITLALGIIQVASDLQGLNSLSLVIDVAMIWPGIAVAAKRCHDRDRSGWFQLIAVIPLVGAVWLLIDLGFLRGTAGPNRFGPDPLLVAGAGEEVSWRERA